MKRLAMRTRLVCSTLVAVAVTGTLAGQARPLRVEDVLAVQQFADREQLAVSPDSRLVAYALVDPGRASALAEADHSNRFSPSGVPVSDRGADVFLTDYRSGTTRNLTGAQGSSWGPVIIRWVSRMPVRPLAMSVRQVVPEPPSQPNPPGTPELPVSPLSLAGTSIIRPQPLWPRMYRT